MIKQFFEDYKRVMWTEQWWLFRKYWFIWTIAVLILIVPAFALYALEYSKVKVIRDILDYEDEE